MHTKSFLFTIIPLILLAFYGFVNPSQAAPQTTIGNGTPASCQTQDAANALSNAVMTGGEINFDCGPDPVMINANTNTTNQTVTLNGDGRIILSGENLRQVFYVYGTGNLTLNDLIIQDGYANGGGALFIASDATVTVNQTTFVSNQTDTHGGGIYNLGTLTIRHSTLGSNQALLSGGAIYNDGGTIFAEDTYFVSNQSAYGGAVRQVGGSFSVEGAAFRSNIATQWGGAVYAEHDPVSFTNTTFSNNMADQGGALYNGDSALSLLNNTFNENRADTGGAIYYTTGTTNLRNNILSGSLDEAGSSPSLNCDGPAMHSEGHNLISDGTCLPNPGAVGDLFNTNPLLGIWEIPAHLYIPQPDSLAIDYGLDCPDDDQRGYPRPLGAACDVGSVEFGSLIFLPLITR